MIGPDVSSPRPIRLLPPSVFERIAAGEVIDRPAAAAKELIENALDGGATRIVVEVRGGGLELLRVTDDGHGIPAEQLRLAFAAHATSKIDQFDDLERLTTLGFRGEALASIAVIAEVMLTSAITGDAAGAGITVRHGEVLDAGTRARTPGTTVTVRDLFGNVPARRRFLGAARVESARIGDVVRRYALGRPDVRFSLSFDGRPAFASDGGGDLARIIATLHGPGAAETLAPVSLDLPGEGHLRGVIGAGGPWYAGRRHVSLFVNGRLVRGGGLAAALEAAYRPFAPAGRHPIVVLTFDLPPALVDANVHPAKLEVRLANERAVAQALTEAVAALFGRTPAGAGASLSLQYRLPLARRGIGEEQGSYDHSPPPALGRELHFLASGQDGMLIAEGVGGLYLIDPHRAHERLLFEAMQAGGADQAGQALLEPALLHPSPEQSGRLDGRAAELEALGFSFEWFGADTVVTRAAPAALGGLPPAVLTELIEQALADAAGWRERLLATAACRAALKKGEPLDPAAARELLRRLTGARSPAVCPHGSPIVVRLADGLLKRLFRW